MHNEVTMREYIARVCEEGDAIEVTGRVSPVYEAPRRSAETDRMLVFNDLGEGWRGVMNLVSDRTSIARALDLPPERVLRTLADARFDGRVGVDGPLQTVRPDLDRVPVMKHYPRDAGRYITAGIVCSRYGGVENASVHRML
ncbi:MAG TPA: UbiD family decarboxylase, partial [Methanoregulaceae archaeon]|nr:UbiD family decarboxylase [Methanoregulaceae archaeon]